MTKIYLGADHGGYELKETIKDWLDEWQCDWEDLGALEYDPADDFPQYALAVAQKVATEPGARGILLCRSGGGMTIAANKVPGARAVQAYATQQIKHDRTNDNVNIMTLAGDWGSDQEKKEWIQTFLETEFSSQPRHQRRLDQIAAYESE